MSVSALRGAGYSGPKSLGQRTFVELKPLGCWSMHCRRKKKGAPFWVGGSEFIGYFSAATYLMHAWIRWSRWGLAGKSAERKKVQRRLACDDNAVMRRSHNYACDVDSCEDSNARNEPFRVIIKLRRLRLRRCQGI